MVRHRGVCTDVSLRNTKPSAIFRISDPKGESARAAAGPQTATLGISIEPDAEVDRHVNAMNGGVGKAPPASTALVSASEKNPAAIMAQATQLAPYIAQNAFSYLSSFAPDSAPQTMPLLQRWLEQFQRKVQTQGLDYLLKTD